MTKWEKSPYHARPALKHFNATSNNSQRTVIIKGRHAINLSPNQSKERMSRNKQLEKIKNLVSSTVNRSYKAAKYDF